METFWVMLVRVSGEGPDVLAFVIEARSQTEAEQRAAAAIARRVPGTTGHWITWASGVISRRYTDTPSSFAKEAGERIAAGQGEGRVFIERERHELRPFRPGDPSYPMVEASEQETSE